MRPKLRAVVVVLGRASDRGSCGIEHMPMIQAALRKSDNARHRHPFAFAQILLDAWRCTERSPSAWLPQEE